MTLREAETGTGFMSLQRLSWRRNRTCYIIFSVPSSLGKTLQLLTISSIINELQRNRPEILRKSRIA